MPLVETEDPMWKKSMFVALVMALSAGVAQAHEPYRDVGAETQRSERARAHELRERSRWARLTFRFAEARALERQADELDRRAAFAERRACRDRDDDRRARFRRDRDRRERGERDRRDGDRRDRDRREERERDRRGGGDLRAERR